MLLIKNGKIIEKNQLVKKDILIDDNKIIKIEDTIDFDCEILDATDCLVMPGAVDVHVHLREPGFEYKETIETGSKSAVAGGFTTICPMPNTKPTPDSAIILQQIIEKSKERLEILEEIEDGENIQEN